MTKIILLRGALIPVFTVFFTIIVIHKSFAADIPFPDIKHTEVSVIASYAQESNKYSYVYSVTSLPENTGTISGINIDIRSDPAYSFNISNPIPSLPDFKASMQRRHKEQGFSVLPVELSGPPNWAHMNLTADGEGSWIDISRSETGALSPGNTVEGLTLITSFPPSIRIIKAIPSIVQWDLYPDADDTEEVKRQRDDFILSLDFVDFTLGPSPELPGGIAHWNKFRNDLAYAIELGWIPDATLADIMVGQLNSAREALDANDGSLAKTRLQTLVEQAVGAVDSQLRNEARALITLNAQSLVRLTRNTVYPFEPKLILTPTMSELPVGVRYTLTAKFINVAHNDEPIIDFPVLFRIEEGPNAGKEEFIPTDVNGEAKFTYIGTRLGADRILVMDGGGA